MFKDKYGIEWVIDFDPKADNLQMPEYFNENTT